MEKNVVVVCYGKKHYFDTISKAVRYFEDGMMSCDPFSSEWARYGNIVLELKSGKNFVDGDVF